MRRDRLAADAGREPGRSPSLVAVLSIQPMLNIFSPHQIMNTSFDPLDLVNTYGAFGSVGKERLQCRLRRHDDLRP